MKRTLLTPILLLALGACAADGTSMNGTAGVPVTPASAPTISANAPMTGEIILVEAVAPVSQRGGNAAVAIGSSILGAVIPGPWGSVAGVATGQAGQLAMNNVDSKSSRYHIRMADGTIQTITQSDSLSLAVGTPVDVLTLADGSNRLVQTDLATVPVVYPAAVPEPI